MKEFQEKVAKEMTSAEATMAVVKDVCIAFNRFYNDVYLGAVTGFYYPALPPGTDIELMKSFKDNKDLIFDHFIKNVYKSEK